MSDYLLDLESMDNGFYLLDFDFDGGRVVRNIVVQHR